MQSFIKYNGIPGNLSTIGSFKGITLNPRFALLKTIPVSIFKGPAEAIPIPISCSSLT